MARRLHGLSVLRKLQNQASIVLPYLCKALEEVMMKFYRIHKEYRNDIPIRRHPYYLRVTHRARWTWNGGDQQATIIKMPFPKAQEEIKKLRVLEGQYFNFEAVE